MNDSKRTVRCPWYCGRAAAAAAVCCVTWGCSGSKRHFTDEQGGAGVGASHNVAGASSSGQGGLAPEDAVAGHEEAGSKSQAGTGGRETGGSGDDGNTGGTRSEGGSGQSTGGRDDANEGGVQGDTGGDNAGGSDTGDTGGSDAGGADTGDTGGSDSGGSDPGYTGGSGGDSGASGTGGTSTGGSGSGPCGGNDDCAGSTPYCVDARCVECQAGTEECSVDEQRRCSDSNVWESINLNFDAHHCGSCNHDCLGADCSAGECQPITIAANQGAPTGITLDDEYVYFTCTRSAEIRRVPKEGFISEPIAIDRTGWPRDIVYAIGMLFFTEDSRVYRLKPDGSETPVIWYDATWTAADDSTYRIDTDYGQSGITDGDATLIWNDDMNILEDVASSVGTGIRVDSGGPGSLEAVAINQEFFFWAWTGNGHNNGYVAACDRVEGCSGGASIATLLPHPVALAFEGDYLYYALEGLDDEATEDMTDLLPDTGSIVRMQLLPDKSWGSPTTLIDGINRPHDIIVDDEWVYWTSWQAQTVSKVAEAGGSEIVLASGEEYPWYLAQDEVSIYWTNAILNGDVRRIAK